MRGALLVSALAMAGLAACERESADLKVAKGTKIGGIEAGKPPPSEGPKYETQRMSLKIPTRLQGHWGMIAADCRPGNQNAKGLLIIDDRDLTFPDAKARLALARLRTPTMLEADFQYQTEAENYTQTETFEVDADVLVRKNDQLAIPIRYERCRNSI